jgi:hypothetical protein
LLQEQYFVLEEQVVLLGAQLDKHKQKQQDGSVQTEPDARPGVEQAYASLLQQYETVAEEAK